MKQAVEDKDRHESNSLREVLPLKDLTDREYFTVLSCLSLITDNVVTTNLIRHHIRYYKTRCRAKSH